MQTRINKKQVSHLIIRELRKTEYIWKPKKVEKCFFGLIKTVYQEGYYDDNFIVFQPEYLKFEVEGYNMIDIDGTLHRLPVVIVFSGKDEILKKVFSNNEIAKEWATKNFPNCERTEK
jgi:hypothetical protein